MAIFFYIFSFVIILGALGVVTSRNPVYSVLWLIFTFLNTSPIFIQLGAEFIALSIVIVYVGSVAVLFLFVVMMMNIDFEETKKSFLESRIISLIVLLLMITDLFLIINSVFTQGYSIISLSNPFSKDVMNTQALGQILYTDYFVPFQLAGIILLLAMVGSISLTLRKREGVKKQSPSKQKYRKIKDSIEMVKVKFKEGVNGIDYK